MARRRRRNRGSPNERYAMAATFLVVGAVMLSVGMYLIHGLNVLRTRGVETQAKVIQETKGRSPEVEVVFYTPTGREVDASSHDYKGSPNTGEYLTIVYDPQNPQHFRDTRLGFGVFTYVLPLIPLGAGAGMLAMSAYTLRVGAPDWIRRGSRY